jgi:hypothetical protein
MKKYILPGYTPELIVKNKKHIAELYKEFGIVIFPGFFKNNRQFQTYVDDLDWAFEKIITRHSADTIPNDLGDKLVMLNKLKPVDGKIITNLGTQPNKFNSFNNIKFSEYITSIVNEVFGLDSILTTPQAGDTLHFFPPGEGFYRYNLPPHQDYQYLMQSPSQITFYMGLSSYKENVGGLRIWEKSNKLGILPTTTNEFGAFEIKDSEHVLKDFTTMDYNWDAGDLGFFDSLLAHSSIPNSSTDAGRVVQIFRFSDINTPCSNDYDFKSAVYKRDGITFAEYHPTLLT